MAVHTGAFADINFYFQAVMLFGHRLFRFYLLAT